MLKPFTYSYSKLKNFENCPKKHYEIELAKNVTEPVIPGGPLDWGNRLHKEFAAVLKENRELAPEYLAYKKWIDAVKAGPGKLYVEQQYALTRDFKPTDWWNKKGDVWYRGIGDVVRIFKKVGLILDWKTGKIQHDSVQLMLMAQCVFSYFPEVEKVLTKFVWLKEDAESPELYDRQAVADEWVGLMPRVEGYKEAYLAESFPPKPSGLCVRHCPVKSCVFHGKGARG